MLAPLLLGAWLAVNQDTAWSAVDRLIEDGVARRAFPGAVVAIGRADTILHLRAFGRQDYQGGPPVTTATVYDLASLTKVVGLTTAMMMLVEEARVELDAPVRNYVQMFGYHHDAGITVRHLLTHSSGLPAFKQWFRTAHSREEMFALAAEEPIEYPTGTRMVYSDIGAINLTAIVESLTGERLDRFLARALFEPLGMTSTRFRPPRGWLARIAPTELDETFRHRLIRGEVHDENAWVMDGVSGHAGLFSTAEDLARFCQMMLRGGTFPASRARSRALVTGRRGPGAASERDVPVRIVQDSTIAQWTRVQQPGVSSRALGWDTPDGHNSAGTRLTARAFGHTGFTGTSIWIDPGQDLFIVLLTNRVNPTRDNTGVFAVRREVADAAVAAQR